VSKDQLDSAKQEILTAIAGVIPPPSDEATDLTSTWTIQ
jgi:hypothetical protein